MAYYTGTANSFADLLSAFTTACVAEGWSWTDDILSKGAAYVRCVLHADGIVIQGGTGQSGADLVNPSPQRPRLGRLHGTLGTQPSWPMNYHIHVFDGPDEVFFVVRHNVDVFWWLAFGLSDVPGIPGTGLWMSAVAPFERETYSNSQAGNITINATGSGTDTFIGGIGSSGALFWRTNSINDNRHQNAVHVNLDGIVWASRPTGAGVYAASSVQAPAFIAPMMARQPNAWNSEAVLLPIQAYMTRSSSKTSLVVDVRRARYVRIDNYVPEEVVTLGADEWKVYPFYRKNTTARDGGILVEHTGTFGWAIRYDGP